MTTWNSHGTQLQRFRSAAARASSMSSFLVLSNVTVPSLVRFDATERTAQLPAHDLREVVAALPHLVASGDVQLGLSWLLPKALSLVNDRDVSVIPILDRHVKIVNQVIYYSASHLLKIRGELSRCQQILPGRPS